MPFDLSQYQQVEDRIRLFWKDHPEGRINTELVHVDDAGGYVVKASVWRNGTAEPDATGFAEEHMTEGHRVNRTWPLENCETSAIGRALANLGYSPKGKRPSREEMSKPSGGTVIGEGTPPDSSGEGSRPQTSPSPEHQYPVDQATCDHKRNTGRWAKTTVDGVERCAKCGLPWLVVLEGTTEDLGPA